MSSALAALRRDFGGDIIEPNEAEYEAASRTVLAAGSPALVLRPSSVRDVQAAVTVAPRQERRCPCAAAATASRASAPTTAGSSSTSAGWRAWRSSTRSATSCASGAVPPGVRSPTTWPHVPGDLVGRHSERRRRRTDLDRWHRLEGPQVRPGAGQRGPRRNGHRRRRGRARDRGGEPGAVLGAARWRWQLRDRHRLRLRRTSDDGRLLRQDLVPGRGSRRRSSRAGRTTSVRRPRS